MRYTETSSHIIVPYNWIVAEWLISMWPSNLGWSLHNAEWASHSLWSSHSTFGNHSWLSTSNISDNKTSVCQQGSVNWQMKNGLIVLHFLCFTVYCEAIKDFLLGCHGRHERCDVSGEGTRTVLSVMACRQWGCLVFIFRHAPGRAALGMVHPFDWWIVTALWPKQK